MVFWGTVGTGYDTRGRRGVEDTRRTIQVKRKSDYEVLCLPRNDTKRSAREEKVRMKSLSVKPS